MYVDPRGPRFAATITTIVLAVTLLTGSAWLLGLQALVFGLAAVRGLQASPYSWLFRRFVRPRLAPPAELEDARPPQFAQAVGLGFAVVGLLGALTGLTPLFLAATVLALAAAFLNAAFGYCLGCEVYLIIRRFIPTREEIPA
jgi:predicted lipid-binding transport protein (Tim44 family)